MRVWRGQGQLHVRCGPQMWRVTLRAARLSVTTASPVPSVSSESATDAASVASDAPTQTSPAAENVRRLRELLRGCTAKEQMTLLPPVHAERRQNRREVWPEVPTAAPLAADETSKASTRWLTEARTPRHQGALEQQPVRSSPSTAEPPLAAPNPLRWYGPPPGVQMDLSYFTAGVAMQWHQHFHDHYFMEGKPTAPLLRCPACLTEQLTCEGQGRERTETASLGSKSCGSPSMGAASSSSSSSTGTCSSAQRLWMDPLTLQRHLSWVHGAQLYTPQEFAVYNRQILHELLHSCGLEKPLRRAASASARETARASACDASPSNAHEDLPLGRDKTTPARLILAVDVANLELGAPNEFLEILQSLEVNKLFSTFPIAVCATHEVFVPLTSKVLHALYQLAALHPASSLHVFFANASLEAGDLLLLRCLHEVLLSSPIRAVPQVLLLTRDGQQRKVAREMCGNGQRTLAPVGLVRSLSSISAAQLVDEVRSVLVSRPWTV